MNRFLICKIKSDTVRGIARAYAAAGGWQPYQGPDHADDTMEQPDSAPFFFLDTKENDFGFCREGSDVHERGTFAPLESILELCSKGPKAAWTDVEVSLGCSRATIYRDGSITLHGGATDLRRIKQLVEIHESTVFPKQ